MVFIVNKSFLRASSKVRNKKLDEKFLLLDNIKTIIKIVQSRRFAMISGGNIGLYIYRQQIIIHEKEGFFFFLIFYLS